jgi:hypothetical protein
MHDNFPVNILLHAETALDVLGAVPVPDICIIGVCIFDISVLFNSVGVCPYNMPTYCV